MDWLVGVLCGSIVRVYIWDAVRMNAFSTTTTNTWVGGGGATRIVMMRLSAAMARGQARIANVTNGVTRYVTVSVASAMRQIGSIDLDSFWRNIRNNAADNMMGEYRLATYLEKIDLVISTDGVKLDFTKMEAVLAKPRWICLARLNGCEAANDVAYRQAA
ncbi:MAG: hypothetical protein QM533_11065 [Cytophagales bacterium]|nr:hypothetical protein [Cytophagales bacterium]